MRTDSRIFLLIILLAPLTLLFPYPVGAASPTVSESLVSPFDYSSIAKTTNVYSGLVEVTVSGVGQGTGTQWNDAFWIYTDPEGNTITPTRWQDQVPLRISFVNPYPWDENGEPIQNYVVMIDGRQVPRGTIPVYNPLHTYSLVLDVGESRTLYFGNVDSGLWDNTGAYNITVRQRPYVAIDEAHASDDRCGVGETQSIRVHASWHDGSDVVNGLVYVDGVEQRTDLEGWANFEAASPTVAKKGWKVTGVSCDGVTDYVQRVELPSVIWDRVKVTIRIVDGRIDIGAKPEFEWSALYEYDSQVFQGSVDIRANSTPSATQVGKASYSISSIEDEKYGLTKFISNSVDCIWDRVKITVGGVTNSHATTGSTESVWFKAAYEYDGEEFSADKGQVFVNNTPMVWSESDRTWRYNAKLDVADELTFEVSGIEDTQYKLTTFIDAVGPQTITWEKPFLETPAGIASIAAVLAVVAAMTLFFLMEKR